MNPVSNFYQSFSGTDTIAFLMMPGCVPIVLGSLTTISYSMYRNKKPVINIGRTNINGVTRGSRIFAGTMIFTLINQHWIREFQDAWSAHPTKSHQYLANIQELKVDELPVFDIMIVSANEYGNSVAMYIWGVDFTDEAQTISVEDLFTENTFSFVARDISVFKKLNVFDNLGSTKGTIGSYIAIKHDATLRPFIFDQEYIDWSKESTRAREYMQAQQEIQNKLEREYNSKFLRDLYYSNSLARPFVGDDVLLVQIGLREKKLYDGDLDGIFSESLSNAVKKYQAQVGFEINGVVDKRLFQLIENGSKEQVEKLAIATDKNGVKIYSEPSLSSTIAGILNYNETIRYSDIVQVIDENGKQRLFLKTYRGYIEFDSIFSFEGLGNKSNFPTLKEGANNNPLYVVLLQDALKAIYNDFVTFQYGVYDAQTVTFVDRFQKEYSNQYGFQYISGEVNPDTWIALDSVSKEEIVAPTEKLYSFDLNKPVGFHDVAKSNITDELKQFYGVLKTKREGMKLLLGVGVISYYPDEYIKSTVERFDGYDNFKITMADYQSFFEYNAEHQSYPEKVEFFVYVNNYNDPYKWIIKPV